RPLPLCIQVAEEQHKKGGKLFMLFCCDLLSRSRLIENRRGLWFAARLCVAVRKTMIGESCAGLMEVVMTKFERVQELLQCANIGVASPFQAADPAIESVCDVHLQGTIGPKRRINAEPRFPGFIGGVDLMVRSEIIARIVGGTDGAYAKFAQNA